MKYFERQIKEAKDNYNYFFMKLIIDILKVLMKLSIILLITCILNYTIINILALIYTIYSLFIIGWLYKYYFNIINDIKDTLGYSKLSFEVDFNFINRGILRSVIKYGK